MNPLSAIDFYKADHRRQYPEGTEYVYSNFTPRSSRLAPVLDSFDDRVVFVGLQGYIKRFLIEAWNQNFFNQPKEKVVAKYKRRMDGSLGEGAIPVDHIEALHDLGYLPVEIKALAEGSRVNIKVPMFTIVNTLPAFYWLTNYLETSLSSDVWKVCTTATIAYEYKCLLMNFAERTGAPADFVPLQGHDFSSRGMSGIEDAAQSSLGHLTSFIGTDSVASIDYAEDYYNAEGVIGVSVPATEHSVMCMGTQGGEVDTFRRLIAELYPRGVVSIVSDTWDFWQVITSYARDLKDTILAREEDALGLAKVVFRPDSGDPVKIICGDPDAEPGSPEYKGAVECLWDIFGGDITDKGYKTLNPRVGLIYGDSITLQRARAILNGMEAKGFASSNIVLGIGSYTYQYLTRDNFGFAMKATWGQVYGEGREIFKDPVTDSGTKKSARGLLRVEKTGEGFELFDQQSFDQEKQGELKTVFKDGALVREQSLTDIRERLAS
ncbi:nicotinate phosphoribosyltransferase [Marinomonas mediterranea]|jgi:Nicotinic acid phosphoribosyltransferase|uniref:Nicotinamide phosphoribosyltransferase n=1 Tax=Marinomonas mediterranea (strain ATCC 700492 / JCM 21426 / NBRC 103028 / MMB-1) TaxID=717774 RepID=F2JZG4_MARM1|nr:nicotinate phosphoribosyltransferase [Marinomonas mediterranea]ADZ89747.1 Nicotinamide phosphoribosyltransferase [Marinomonas mediterranea MMB-1]WCN07840.1 nicotinate phosphoribosyltransferase [Marinomonas mediterranea]WCN11934.1 nicotinate phosphoribosyltransferase [Marinomonas mediterranea]WCN15972.1 nicotinate phosphoribosyltransferase [Marinomonas mediterranea MMB-1]